MGISLIRAYRKEIRMSDPKNGSENSDGRRTIIIESDQGGSKRSTDQGRTSAPIRPAPPKPQHNPNK